MVHLVDVGARVPSSAVTSASEPGTSRTSTARRASRPAAHHAALDDLRQHQRIDVAAAEHQPDLLALEALRVPQQRGQPGGAGAFDHRLLDLEQHQDRLLDVALVDQQEVVDHGAR